MHIKLIYEVINEVIFLLIELTNNGVVNLGILSLIGINSSHSANDGSKLKFLGHLDLDGNRILKRMGFTSDNE